MLAGADVFVRYSHDEALGFLHTAIYPLGWDMLGIVLSGFAKAHDMRVASPRTAYSLYFTTEFRDEAVKFLLGYEDFAPGSYSLPEIYTVLQNEAFFGRLEHAGSATSLL